MGLSSTKPAPGEVLFHITDNTEFATLHADEFRKGMLERDELLGAIEQSWRPEVRALRAKNEQLKETIAEWQEIHGTFTGDVHSACQVEIERLRAENTDLRQRLANERRSQ